MTEHTRSYTKGFKNGVNYIISRLSDNIEDCCFTVDINGVKVSVVKTDTMRKVLERNRIKEA